jgi:hypothetical protein
MVGGALIYKADHETRAILISPAFRFQYALNPPQVFPEHLCESVSLREFVA